MKPRPHPTKESADAAAASTTIDIPDVKPARDPLPEIPAPEAVRLPLGRVLCDWPSCPTSNWLVDEREAGRGTIEACSDYHGHLVAGVVFHPVVAAVHHAFASHRPLVLSPDIIWLMVAQGFANHVNANAEELRQKFVAHSGKEEIGIRRDDFVKGDPDNPWPEVFDAFALEVREHIGESTYALLLPTFSTTGPVERAAAQIVLLDAMQSYFEFICTSVCGIPQFVLEGTAGDWEALTARARALGHYGLRWWTDELVPVLEKIAASARGAPDIEFWRSIYKLESESGGPYITGWITAFFPYLKGRKTGHATHPSGVFPDRPIVKMTMTDFLDSLGLTMADLADHPGLKMPDFDFSDSPDLPDHPGLTMDDFPGGLAKAPFVWNYLHTEYPMEFLGGFVGVRQDPETLGLRPEIGWAVRDREGRS